MVENERSLSSSDSQTNSFSSDESLQFFHDENEETSDENLSYYKENITCNGNSEDETEDVSRKLSAVMEQPEDSLNNAEHPKTSGEQTDKELNRFLEDRIKSLQEIMLQLKEQLLTEVALWRKEKEELQLLRERSDILALEEANAAARAAAAAYAAESPLSSELGDYVDITSEQALKELTILEYEKELAKYQDALSFAQAEKRYNARRQMIARAYKQKAMEIEKLCNEELEKIQLNASHLEPLKRMALQWRTHGYNHDDLSNDASRTMVVQKLSSKAIGNEFYDFCNKIDAELNMVTEKFGTKCSLEDSLKRQTV